MCQEAEARGASPTVPGMCVVDLLRIMPVGYDLTIGWRLKLLSSSGGVRFRVVVEAGVATPAEAFCRGFLLRLQLRRCGGSSR